MNFDPDVEHIFSIYPWPGNVRELENCVEYAVNVRAGSGIITRENLPLSLRNYSEKEIQEVKDGKLDQSKRDLIALTLQKNNYNIQKTARELGCARSTIYRNLKNR